MNSLKISFKWYYAALSLLILSAVLFAVISLFPPARAHGDPSGPTPDQIALADKVANAEARKTIPGLNGRPLPQASLDKFPVGKWPDNVASVHYVTMTRAIAGPFTGSSSPDESQEVVVIRMTGKFSVRHLGMTRDQTVTNGTAMTLVMDAKTGLVTDFGIEGEARHPMPTQSIKRFIR